MRFIIEFDGVVFDAAPLHYQAHVDAATAVGWSRLDQASFWRSTRKQGQEARLLPGATPVKRDAYETHFAQRVEADEIVNTYRLFDQVVDALAALRGYGSCLLVTAGSNPAARQRVLERSELGPNYGDIVAFDPDPRRRPGEFVALSEGDGRTLVVVAGDSLARSASQTDLVTVGIASGPCTAARLYQAGAGIAYRDLQGLVTSLEAGGEDLARAGLLPAPLG